MPVSEQTNQYLHRKLPIGDDEKILGVYRHHWFAYVSLWIGAVFLALIIMGAAIALVVTSDPMDMIGQHRGVILATGGVLSGLALIFTAVPVWLRSQEQLVLTEQAILQILQPSLFVNKISQLNLSHVSDVSARQDFFGTMFGYGHITIETPGEQDDYQFTVLPEAHTVAKQIVEAHENYNAALQGGRLHSTLGNEAAPIDPAEYQKFLAFEQAQQLAALQKQAQNQPGNQPPTPPGPANPVPEQGAQASPPPADGK
jgi:hypothetical protein